MYFVVNLCYHASLVMCLLMLVAAWTGLERRGLCWQYLLDLIDPWKVPPEPTEDLNTYLGFRIPHSTRESCQQAHPAQPWWICCKGDQALLLSWHN